MDIISFTCSYILGTIGALTIIKWGETLILLDHSNNRSSHQGAIPKGGGIGILAAFIISSIIIKVTPAFWIPASIISFISLIGDRKDLSPLFRLPVQFIAAILFLVFSDHIPLLNTSLLLVIFFALFIIATANWYNFMDGINGIASITAVIGFSLLALYSNYSLMNNNLTALLICIVFACLGFLPFNFPRAKVFMGDVGSILLGFVFASFVVILSKSFLDFMCLSGFLFPFYADEFITIAIRLKDNENLLKAHRRHFYQILVNEKGLAHWKVSVGYGIVQLFVGITIIYMRQYGLAPVIMILIMFFGISIWVNYFFRFKPKKTT